MFTVATKHNFCLDNFSPSSNCSGFWPKALRRGVEKYKTKKKKAKTKQGHNYCANKDSKAAATSASGKRCCQQAEADGAHLQLNFRYNFHFGQETFSLPH